VAGIVQHRTSSGRVSFGDVLAVRPFRVVYLASVLSGLGDAVARLAVAVLVFQRSHSALLTAASYALTYLPWLIWAGRLGALGDRLAARPLLVGCDIYRAVLGAVLLVPGLPAGVVLLLAFGVALGEPAFGSSRSALVPELVSRSLYPTASALMSTSAFIVRVIGLGVGGALVAAAGARPALAVDVLSFALSALLIGGGLAGDPQAEGHPSTRQVGGASDRRLPPSGLSLVRRDARLRWLVLVASVAACSGAVAESSAVLVAAQHGAGPRVAGLLAAALPLGFVVSMLLSSRLLSPHRRLQVLPGLTLLSAAGTIPLMFDPSIATVVALYALAALGGGFQLTANQLFVLAVPAAHRAKCFAVAQASLLSAQGIAITAAGAVQSSVRATTVVGVVGLITTLLVALLLLTRPDLTALLDEPASPDAALHPSEPVGLPAP